MSAHRAAPAGPPLAARLAGRLPSLSTIRTMVRLVCLTVVGGLLVWAFLPYAAGWHTTLVISGSMTPAIRTGDLVVIAPVTPEFARTAAVAGAVIQVDNPVRPGELLLHRAQRRDSDGSIITKGDANAVPDRVPVSPAHVRGIARLRVPYAGLPILWLHNWRTSQVPLTSLALVMLALAWPERRPAPPADQPRTRGGAFITP
jgi:signal peptidase